MSMDILRIYIHFCNVPQISNSGGIAHKTVEEFCLSKNTLFVNRKESKTVYLCMSMDIFRICIHSCNVL